MVGNTKRDNNCQALPKIPDKKPKSAVFLQTTIPIPPECELSGSR